jgi:hypothetical protein
MISRTLGRLAVALAFAALFGVPATATAQIQMAVTPSVVGPTITLSWAPVAGADTYVVQAGLSPGSYVFPLPAAATGFQVAAPAVGTYHLRAVALQGGTVVGLSDDIPVTVVTLVATPVNVEAFSYCGNVLLRWQPGPGSAPLGYQVAVQGPGGLGGVIPTTGVSLGASNPPPGPYAFNVTAVAANGASAPSATVNFEVGGAAPPTIPTAVISSVVFGGYVDLRWAPVPGAASYTLTALQNGVPVLGQDVPASVNRVSRFGIPFGNYEFRVVANLSCGQSPTATTNFVVDASSGKMQPRAADPAGPTPPNYLRLPNRLAVVQELAARYPNEMRGSCGDHRFLYRLLARLRQEDKRWGLNWKRAQVGSLSEDVLTYNFGSEADEGTRQVHVVDFIGGHCGPNPGPAWIDQTVLFSTGAMWTLVPYIQAGYTP